MEENPVNPHLVDAVSGLAPGTALDAGCGAGAEAIWLASQDWQVTAADISADALDRARRRAVASGMTSVDWVEADLSVWSPDTQYGLVTTHYAHPSIPQVAFYERISHWVAPGGTLLIVGHLHNHQRMAEVSAAEITAVLDSWEIVTAEEKVRTIGSMELHDVVVQAVKTA
jgi:2-polyprenyl-3-methyl-5-hydroxy-6-metoxy-1,4-benzoquinol methylase